MAFDWSIAQWRLIHEDDFSGYANQAAYEAAYPDVPIIGPTTDFGTWGLTEGPGAVPGVYQTEYSYNGVGKRVTPCGRFAKFKGRWENSREEVVPGGTGATYKLLNVYYLTEDNNYNIFEFGTIWDYPLAGYTDDDTGFTVARDVLTDFFNGPFLTARAPVFPHGSTRDIEIRIAFATLTETSPGVYTKNSDGAVEVFVDGVSQLLVEGNVSNWQTNVGPNEPQWNAFIFGAHNRFTNLEVYDSCPEDPDPQPSTPPTTTAAGCPCPRPDPRTSSGPSGTGALGGGGSGNSGTNEGGYGWVAQCEGGGTVDTYATASAGESMVGVRDPRVWAEIAFATMAGTAATAAPVYWSQDVSIPDAPANYGGRKDGRAFSISKISRSLSDDNGNYTGSKVTVQVNDKDRAALRTRLGSQSARYVWDREGIIRIASETNRRTGYSTPPRELFRGMSKDVDLGAKFTGSISFEDRVCSQFGQFGPDRSFSSRLLTLGLWAGCPRELVGKPQQWIFGEVSDEGATHPTTGESASKGLVPIWLVGASGDEDEYHLAAHECVDVILYGSDGADVPARVALDASAYRVEYRTVTDSDTGLAHGVTSVFLPTGSIPSEAHKNGRLNMAANVCGVKGENGELITDLFSIYQFIFEHLILPTQESLTGEYVGSPQWADGRYMVHSASFAAAQAYSAQRIGGDGYQGGFVLGGPHGAVTLRELLKRMSNSGDCWFSWSHGGQIKVSLLDDTAAIAGATNYREPVDLREWQTPRLEFDEVENPVLYTFDWDDDKQKFRVSDEQVSDDVASARIGRPRPSPSPIQMRCVRDETTARDVAQRRLLRRKYPPAYIPVVLPIDGCDVEPGDIITITSQEGVGSGSDERALFVRDWSFDPKSMRTTLLCRDLTDILVDNRLQLEASPDVWLLQLETNVDEVFRLR